MPEMIPPKLEGKMDGWNFSCECPEHGLVYADFLYLKKNDALQLVAVCICEDGGEELELALAPHPDYEAQDCRMVPPEQMAHNISYGFGMLGGEG